MKDKHYYIYILANKTNSTVYIGVTNHLIRRVYEHKNKLIPGFTSQYNLNKLVYFEEFEMIEEAIKREKTLKNLVRRKKNLLIEKDNLKWEDLYEKLI